MPPTVRSPMVIRKFLDATAGMRSTRRQASRRSRSVTSKGGRCFAREATLRVMRGGLPSSTSIGMSTASRPKCRSPTTRRPSPVASPSTANGQRSRSQIARNSVPGSSIFTSRSSKRAPQPAPWASSGSALESPPAPTSWIDRTGFPSPASRPSPFGLPICQQRSITSWARRWISGLPRCTEAKSRSAAFVPVVIDEAAPPPRPISMPGPPNWISSVPGGKFSLCDWSARMLPIPPAIMIGLW